MKILVPNELRNCTKIATSMLVTKHHIVTNTTLASQLQHFKMTFYFRDSGITSESSKKGSMDSINDTVSII